jgi:quercetin dioxygenase-like cupin family protein
MGALLAVGAIGACREPAKPEIPPLTTATPASGSNAAIAAAAPASDDASALVVVPSPSLDASASPVKARFVDAPAKLEASQCQRGLLAVVKGTVTALGETLAAGDVLVVSHGTAAFDATGRDATMVWASTAIPDCAVLSLLPLSKTVVRGAATPKLEWAGGTMSARLDVETAGPRSPSPSPELYLGRLEGTAAVAEHNHPTSWEILAAVDASGTFVLGGTEHHLTARQIMMIPPGVKHAWKPEPGSKLVAVQMYAAPGPELRFGALAAADKAAVNDAGPRDAR